MISKTHTVSQHATVPAWKIRRILVVNDCLFRGLPPAPSLDGARNAVYDYSVD